MRRLLWPVALALLAIIVFPMLVSHSSAASASDPVLLGNQTVQSISDSSSYSASEAFGFTASTSGTATSASVYLTSTDGVTVGLYADSNGTPTTRLDEGSVTTNAAGWVAVPLNGGVQITSGTRYWIAVGANTGGQVTYRDAGNSGSNPDYSGSGFASPYSTTGHWTSNPISAYISGTTTTTTSFFSSTTSRSTTSSTVLFGDQKVESAQDSNAPGLAQAFRTTSSTRGTAQSISFYVDEPNTAATLTLGLYSDAGGHPGSLLASGSLPSPKAGAWNLVPISATSVGNGTYWIAVLGKGGMLYYRDLSSGAACKSEVESQTASTLPSSWSSRANYWACPVSAYVNGTLETTSTISSSPSTTSSGSSSTTTSSTTTSSTTTSSSSTTSGGVNCSPSASDTMTNTVSHLCGFADTTNTGVPVGTTLYRVPQDITAATAATGYGWHWEPSWGAIMVDAGGLVTNVDVDGGVVFQTIGGALENSRVTMGGENSYPVQLRSANNVTIRDNDIHGPVQTPFPRYCDNGIRDIYGDSENITIQRNNIWYCASPMNNIANGGLIEQNYMHDNAYGSPDDHTNGIQFEPGSGKLMTVRNNTIFNPLSQTDAIILSNDSSGAESNRVIDHNLLGGGGYSFYGSGWDGASVNTIRFTNNHFSRIYFNSGGYWGPDVYWQTGNGNVWSGNVWDDSNQVITAP